MSNLVNKKLLIISNNPISLTRNNGKTIASFIKDIPKKNVRQLYFNSENPSIEGYSYFQLSDYDIIHGFINRKNRGRVISLENARKNILNRDAKTKDESKNNRVTKLKINDAHRLLREILWIGKWKSNQLNKWLDEFCPDIIFFVAGDSLFAYKITDFVIKRFNSKLVTYITDDYIMDRKIESIIGKFRRNLIKNRMINCIKKSKKYFTISELMKEEYEKLTGVKSKILMNIVSSMKLDSITNIDKEYVYMIYTGSLYYGRDEIIGKVADSIKKYNENVHRAKPIILKVYSNIEPDEESKKKFERTGICEYYGSLKKEELIIELNKADILLFVESFETEMKEKTKYSLSTKIPEYLSLSKLILAVGPSEIGSMMYLSDVAFCSNSCEEIYTTITDMSKSEDLINRKSKKALEKYKNNHNEKKCRLLFIDACEMKETK